MTEHLVEIPVANIVCNDTSWIWTVFGHCVHNSVETWAFGIGFVSFTIWLFPTMPQIYENFKRGHCDDALSIYFLLMIYSGDWLSLIGAVLSNQLPVQIYVGAYFIFQDSILVGQYFYYKFKIVYFDARDNEKMSGKQSMHNMQSTSLLLATAVIMSLMVETVSANNESSGKLNKFLIKYFFSF